MNHLVDLLKGNKAVVYACPNTGITYVWDGKRTIQPYYYSPAMGFYMIDDPIRVDDFSDLPIDLQDAVILSKRNSEKIGREMETASREVA